MYDLTKMKKVCEGGDSMEKRFDPTAETEEAVMKTVSMGPRTVIEIFMYISPWEFEE